MPEYYLDSSAILKRFRTEQSSTNVESLFVGTDRLFASFLSVLEARAAFARMRRNREISARLYQEWKDRLLIDAALRLTLVALSDDVLADSLRSIDKYALKAPDAIQLASGAETRRTFAPDDLFFVCADRQLIEAAVEEGFVILNPELA